MYESTEIHFPTDEGVHPEMLTEWWYANFGLTDSKGREYGAMVAYFNAGLRILSICDLKVKRFYHEVSISTLHSSQGALDLRWGSDDHWFCSNAQAPSYHLLSQGSKVGLNVYLNSLKPPLLVGGNGFIKWPFGSSYYYSLTRLGAQGQIRLPGRAIDVKGIGWMDHQWMNFLPAMVNQSYEWFSVQLDNYTEVVLWQVVNRDESIESRQLTIMFPDNSVYCTNRFALEKAEYWTSPKTGRQYGILWRLREEAKGLDLEIRAGNLEQEIEMSKTLGFEHAIWEGRTIVSGYLAGNSISGTGYAELIRPPSSQEKKIA